MTGWPYCLAEIALYALFASMAIAMGLDARDRWRQLRERDAAEHDQEHDDATRPQGSTSAAPPRTRHQDDGPPVSAVRCKHDAEHDHDEPPPLAS